MPQRRQVRRDRADDELVSTSRADERFTRPRSGSRLVDQSGDAEHNGAEDDRAEQHTNHLSLSASGTTSPSPL
jgi:hypothetical protein